jgi:hypothetical protein
METCSQLVMSNNPSKMYFLLLLCFLFLSVLGYDTECFLNSSSFGELVSALELDTDCFLNASTFGTLDMKFKLDAECVEYGFENDTKILEDFYQHRLNLVFLIIPIAFLLIGQIYLVFQVTKISVCKICSNNG